MSECSITVRCRSSANNAARLVLQVGLVNGACSAATCYQSGERILAALTAFVSWARLDTAATTLAIEVAVSDSCSGTADATFDEGFKDAHIAYPREISAHSSKELVNRPRSVPALLPL